MRRQKLFTITIFIVLTCLTILLCACDKIPGIKNEEIKQVDLKVNENLQLKDDGFYHMALNSNSYAYLEWHNIQVKNPNITWYQKEGDKEFVELTEQSNKLVLDSSKLYSGGLYIYATVEGIKSNEIKVLVDFASLETEDIKSSNFKVENKKIQILQKDFVYETIDIELLGNFNREFLDPSVNYISGWYINSQKISDGDTCSINISKLKSDEKVREIEITYRVSYDERYEESLLIIVIIREYDPLEKITLDVKGANEIIDDISPCNFVILDEAKDFGQVKVSVDTFPNTARLYSKCEWRLRSEVRDIYLIERGRQISFKPDYGKNVVMVTIDNVRSYQVVVYAFKPSDYEIYKSLIMDQFFWNGNWNDQYISDQIDLNYSVANHLAKHEIGLKQNVYIAKASWVYDGKITEEYNYYSEYRMGALQSAILDAGEAGLYRIGVEPSAYWFKEGTIFSQPAEAIETLYNVTQNDTSLPMHYSKSKSRLKTYEEQKNLPLQEQRILPIDDKREVLVTTSDNLYRFASWGYKPKFEDNIKGNNLKNLYQIARQILFEIIDDSMNDVEKVYAIYEWIIYNIEYDYMVVEPDIAYTEDVSKYNAFYLEGVFLDKRAVCDGRAKAVTLFCSMEGISSIRVIGEARGAFGNLLGGHAWNKVLVDPNGDDIKEWYVIDTTWGDSPLNKEMQNGVPLKYEIEETLNYKYCFRRDKDLSTHVIKMPDCPVANTEFVYKKS